MFPEEWLYASEARRARRREGRRNAHYQRFLRTVRDLGALDAEEAEIASIAVLAALEHRLFGDSARKLESQLPSKLRELLSDCPLHDQVPEKLKLSELIDFIAIQLGTAPEYAEELARIVFAAVRAHISPGEVEQIATQLPKPIARLWRG